MDPSNAETTSDLGTRTVFVLHNMISFAEPRRPAHSACGVITQRAIFFWLHQCVWAETLACSQNAVHPPSDSSFRDRCFSRVL